MEDFDSLAHVRWECKYHVVFIPKYRRKAPAEYRPIFLLDALTGFRREEILALQWKDVDWLNQEIIIERAAKKA